MKKLIILLTFIVLTACSAVTHDENTLVNLVGYADNATDNFTVDADWWKAYNDAELNKLVDLALANNIDYAQSAINIDLALYQANLAGLDLYPTLSGSLGASANKDLTGSESFNKSFSGELGLNYELDLYGKIRDSQDIQQLEYEATIFDRETARLTLINSVVDVYFNLTYLEAAQIIAEANLTNTKALYDIVNAKYIYGKSDSSELLQAEQALISADDNLISIEDQIKSAEQSLRNLLNIQPADLLDPQYADIMTVTPIGVNLDVPLAVLAERPDLKAGELRLLRSFKNVNIQTKGWYPSVSLRSSLGSSADNIGETFNFPMFGLGLSVNLPFLSWNTVRTNVKISEKEYESALLGFEGTVNTALNEVAYYYYAYETSRLLSTNSLKTYEKDKQLTAYYDVRYRSGKIELSELLNAINNERNSQRNLLNNIYQMIKYENMTYKAMAGRYEEK
jgi:NodT family efflux transporter outer membrane factor (OMF) lipoprotein